MNYKNNKKEKLDFVYIGVGRAASTWIYQCLKEHPQVCVTRKKEVLPIDKAKNKPNKQLSDFLDICLKDQIKGTFAPNFFLEQKNAFLLKKYFPDIKIIACLRNPIDRAYSHYWMEKSVGKIRQSISFDEAIKEVPKYLDMSYYYSQMKLYLDIFGSNNVLILIYENIDKDHQDFISKIYKFLNVDSAFSPSLLDKVLNPSSEVRLKFLFFQGIIKFIFDFGKKIKKSNIGNSFVILLKKIKVHQCFYYLGFKNLKDPTGLKSKPLKKPLLLSSTRQDLYDLYKEDIRKLEKLISLDLSFWK